MAWIDPDWREVSKEDMKRWGSQPVPDTPAARTVKRVGIIIGMATIALMVAVGIALLVLLV